MRRAAGIFISSFATLLVMALPVVPHHHHGDLECMILERCESHNVYNDEHTTHHADGADSGEKSSCIKNIKALVVKSNVFDDVDDDICSTSVLALSSGVSLFDIIGCETFAGDSYEDTYKSFSGGAIRLLRSPPCFVS